MRKNGRLAAIMSTEAGKEQSSSQEEAFTKVETLSEEEYASSKVERKRYTLRDGQNMLTTVIRPNCSAKYKLKIQPNFLERSIQTESQNGLLIKQKSTIEKWGSIPVGIRPEEFIKSELLDTIAFNPTNAGWQREAFWVKEGKLLMLPNDMKTLSGKFTILGMNKQGEWFDTSVNIHNGRIDPDAESNISKIQIGFSMPKVLQNGRVLPLEEYIGDPRLLADFRNVFDFAGGKQLPSEYWLLIRRFLPTKEFAGKRLIRGDVVVTRDSTVKSSDVTDQLEVLVAQAGLSNTICLNYNSGRSLARIAIVKTLPKNRIPVFGLGFNKEKQLVVVCIDGRQQNISVGATLEEAASIMRENDISNGYIGSAGGDVIIATNSSRFLNIPSSVNRTVPSVLMIQ